MDLKAGFKAKKIQIFFITNWREKLYCIAAIPL